MCDKIHVNLFQKLSQNCAQIQTSVTLDEKSGHHQSRAIWIHIWFIRHLQRYRKALLISYCAPWAFAAVAHLISWIQHFFLGRWQWLNFPELINKQRCRAIACTHAHIKLIKPLSPDISTFVLGVVVKNRPLYPKAKMNSYVNVQNRQLRTLESRLATLGLSQTNCAPCQNSYPSPLSPWSLQANIMFTALYPCFPRENKHPFFVILTCIEFQEFSLMLFFSSL